MTHSEPKGEGRPEENRFGKGPGWHESDPAFNTPDPGRLAAEADREVRDRYQTLLADHQALLQDLQGEVERLRVRFAQEKEDAEEQTPYSAAANIAYARSSAFQESAVHLEALAQRYSLKEER